MKYSLVLVSFCSTLILLHISQCLIFKSLSLSVFCVDLLKTVAGCTQNSFLPLKVPKIRFFPLYYVMSRNTYGNDSRTVFTKACHLSFGSDTNNHFIHSFQVIHMWVDDRSWRLILFTLLRFTQIY
jgi:hypothetical protein